MLDAGDASAVATEPEVVNVSGDAAAVTEAPTAAGAADVPVAGDAAAVGETPMTVAIGSAGEPELADAEPVGDGASGTGREA